MTPEYAAGFFDGEGHVSICVAHSKQWKRKYYALHVVVVNTNLEVLLRLRDQFGGSIAPKKLYAAHHKPSYRWRICSRQGLAFLEVVLPFLVVKKKEAEVAIEFQSSMRHLGNRYVQMPDAVCERRAAMHDELKRLKHAKAA